MSSNPFTAASLFDVKGLKVLVTGGGTGIGLMITRALVSNGATVYITGRRDEVLQKAADSWGKDVSGSIVPLQGDTTDKQSIQALVKEVESKEGYIDILINNAGVSGPTFDGSLQKPDDIGSALFDADYEDALKLLKINVLGYYYVSAAFIPLLNKSPNSPQLIHVTSNASFGRKSMVGILYSLTKAASTHLSKMLATHLSQSKIRSNVLAPGLFPSELTAGESNQKNESHLDDTLGLDIPSGRPGYDKEMAAATLFLASKNQAYTNGSVVLIDGGVLNVMPSTF